MSRAYSYYDSPDGYDLFHKTDYVCRRAAVFSSGLAIVDVMCVTQPKTYFAIAERYLRVFAPPIIAGALFTTTVYIATNIRKKDDSNNHILGAVVSACYLGKYVKNIPVVCALAVPATIMAVMYKDHRNLGDGPFQPSSIDNLSNVGGTGMAAEYDFLRTSMYKDKNHWVYSDWFN